MQTLTPDQLATMRARMPAFAELEARRIAADANAERSKRVAAGLEKLEPVAPPEPKEAKQ